MGDRAGAVRETPVYVVNPVQQQNGHGIGALRNTEPTQALLYALEEIQRTTEALIAAYKAKLALDPPSGGMLSRWQSRTQSALRAAGKAYAKATASIRNLNRQMTREK